MGQPLQSHLEPAPDCTESWALRLAQRALAALLEGSRQSAHIRQATLRKSAVASLSALSVDDRGLIAGWLSLLMLNASASRQVHDLGTLARIDGALAVAVSAQIPAALVRYAQPAVRQMRAASSFAGS